MYAIVDIAGQQFKVKQGQQIYVHRLEAEEGSNLSINKVLMIDNEGKVKVGTPLLSGAQV
ncbi:MAG: 50S ribosomal protein L21, partial [Bacteroidales bacterium]|nr:50S ribosomal protein L21 [Bacteroidales bacterium]